MTLPSESGASAPSAAPSCRVTTATVSSPSRCARVSPTHSTGRRSARSAAPTFWPVCSSVSAKTCRRSEWPIRTARAPAWTASGPEIAPVYAPFGSQWMSWAPASRSARCSRPAATASSETAGGKNHTSRPGVGAYACRKVVRYSRASRGPMCIFQLAANTSGLTHPPTLRRPAGPSLRGTRAWRRPPSRRG